MSIKKILVLSLMLPFCTQKVNGAEQLCKKEKVIRFLDSKSGLGISAAVITSILYSINYYLNTKRFKIFHAQFNEALAHPEKHPSFSQELVILCNQLMLEKNIDTQKVIFASGVGPRIGLMDDFMAIPLSKDLAGLSIPIKYINQFNNLLNKKIVSLEETDELNQLIFLLGHELEHIKKYLSGNKFSAMIAQTTLTPLFALHAGISLPLLVSCQLKKGSLKTIPYFLLNNCISYLLQLIVIAIKYNEEVACDLQASKNENVLQQGITFFNSTYIRSINALAIAQNPLAQIIKQYSKKWAVAWATLHPHHEVRQEALKEQIEKNRKESAKSGI